MTPEKTKELYEKYPLIFVQKDEPITRSCMAFGFECSQGWFDIIDELCSTIQNHIDNENRSINYKREKGELPPDAPNFPQIEAVQVKEKFGGLRFYVNHYDDFIRGAIDMAESISLKTCEDCGNKGTTGGRGWITTLCQPCRDAHDARYAKEQEEYEKRLTVEMKDVTVAP